MTRPLPYTISVLCYLFNHEGHLLLLHRRKPPNKNLFSPIGGKLDQSIGEGPFDCAVREIQEETGLHIQQSDLHLTGVVSEAGYENQGHWLMFLFEVTQPVTLQPTRFDEGQLEWHSPKLIAELNLPDTDRQIIWPLFWKYRGQFFTAHIHCCEDGQLEWRLQQPASHAPDR